MLQNAYFLAKIGADTAEKEQHFAEILPKRAALLAPAAGARGPAQVPRGGERRAPAGPLRRTCVEERVPLEDGGVGPDFPEVDRKFLEVSATKIVPLAQNRQP